MVFVFLTFATLRQTSMKQLGVGLAFAVLLDSTVVRTILLPGAMAWLGERNWITLRRRAPDTTAAAPAPLPTPGAPEASPLATRLATMTRENRRT
jgi:putative drug exporter of the RND superfamily